MNAKNQSQFSVVGGGIVGLCTAYQLAKNDLSVTLFEQNMCGSGATGSALGILWPPSPLRLSEFKHLHNAGLLKYRDCVEELEYISGIEVGFRRCGGLEIISSQSQLEMAKTETESFSKIDSENQQITLSLIRDNELNILEPKIVSPGFGAIVSPFCAYVDVRSLLNALKVACIKMGVTILENSPVTGLLLEKDRVEGVLLKREPYLSDGVIVTSGFSMSDLHPLLHKYAFTKPVKGQAILLQLREKIIDRVIRWKRIFIRPQENNRLEVGSTTELKGSVDLKLTDHARIHLLETISEILPPVKNGDVIEQWAGLRPVSNDRKPYIGPVPEVSGLLVAGAHYKIGLAFGFVTAEIIHGMITQGKPAYSIASLTPRLNC